MQCNSMQWMYKNKVDGFKHAYLAYFAKWVKGQEESIKIEVVKED